MSKKDEVTIKKENLLKAYRNGCADVKAVLENLFSDDIEPLVPCAGDIWKRNDGYFYIIIETRGINGKIENKLVSLCSRSVYEIPDDTTNFTDCPNACIKVIEGDE